MDVPEPLPIPSSPSSAWDLARPAAALLGLTAVVFFTLGTVTQVLDLASGLVVTQLVVFLLPAVLFARAGNTTARSFLRWDGALSGRSLALVALASVANYFVAAAFMGLCTQLLPESWRFADAARVLAAEGGPRLSVIVFAVVVLAPLCEESLFRGALQRSLSNRLGPWTGILLTALAFSALHADPIGFLPRLELGILFGWLAWRTGSLAAPVLAHAINNGAATLLFYFAGSGGEPETEASTTLLLLTLAVGAVILLPTLRALDLFAPERPTDAAGPDGIVLRPPVRLDPARPIALRPDSLEISMLGVLLFLGLGSLMLFVFAQAS